MPYAWIQLRKKTYRHQGNNEHEETLTVYMTAADHEFMMERFLKHRAF